MITLIGNRVQSGLRELEAIRSRPVMQNPAASLEERHRDIDHGLEILRSRMGAILARHYQDLAAARATLAAISPQATLERGYAVLRKADKSVVTDAATVKKGDLLEAVLASGSLVATVFGTSKAGKEGNNNE